MGNELTLNGLYWVIGICFFIFGAIMIFLGSISMTVKSKVKVLFIRASIRLKNLWTLIKNHRKWIRGFLLGVVFVGAVIFAIHWEGVSQKWFTPSLQEQLVEIDEEYQGLIKSDQGIQNLETDIVNLESQMNKVQQNIQEKVKLVSCLKSQVEGKGLTESIVVDDNTYIVRDLIREIRIVNVNIGSLNFNLQSFNQERVELVKRLGILREQYVQQSEDYVQGIQVSSHLEASEIIGENQEIAEAFMDGGDIADSCSE
ncbi:MAG: hypothetical protein P9X22_00355 [Candidatus Zapsychrus exili]|nr:hypothetical protein [Candidatus Zapsychrus exili]